MRCSAARRCAREIMKEIIAKELDL